MGRTFQLVVITIVHELVWSHSSTHKALLVLLLHVEIYFIVAIESFLTEPVQAAYLTVSTHRDEHALLGISEMQHVLDWQMHTCTAGDL